MTSGVTRRIRGGAAADCVGRATIVALGCAIVLASLGVAIVRAAAARSAAGAGDPDPAERKALVAVCGKCHKVSLFDQSLRSEPDWMDTLQTMVDRGAAGTDEQFARIVNYLRRTLTIVNINSATAQQLVPVLGVSEQTAQAIVAQRNKQGKFTGLAEIKSIQGVDAASIEARKARIVF
jgi:competence ComEA-like helix-hairpin-helix protein